MKVSKSLYFFASSTNELNEIFKNRKQNDIYRIYIKYIQDTGGFQDDN